MSYVFMEFYLVLGKVSRLELNNQSSLRGTVDLSLKLSPLALFSALAHWLIDVKSLITVINRSRLGKQP